MYNGEASKWLVSKKNSWRVDSVLHLCENNVLKEINTHLHIHISHHIYLLQHVASYECTALLFVWH